MWGLYCSIWLQQFSIFQKLSNHTYVYVYVSFSFFFPWKKQVDVHVVVACCKWKVCALAMEVLCDACAVLHFTF